MPLQALQSVQHPRSKHRATFKAYNEIVEGSLLKKGGTEDKGSYPHLPCQEVPSDASFDMPKTLITKDGLKQEIWAYTREERVARRRRGTSWRPPASPPGQPTQATAISEGDPIPRLAWRR